jgi:hypothetical protein
MFVASFQPDSAITFDHLIILGNRGPIYLVEVVKEISVIGTRVWRHDSAPARQEQ